MLRWDSEVVEERAEEARELGPELLKMLGKRGIVVAVVVVVGEVGEVGGVCFTSGKCYNNIQAVVMVIFEYIAGRWEDFMQ